MREGCEPASHADGKISPDSRPPQHVSREGLRIGRGEIDEVEQILERQRVIHGAPLEVSAVRKDLLRELAIENFEPGVEPVFRLRTVEIGAGKDERLGV